MNPQPIGMSPPPPNATTVVHVAEPSQVGEARRAAAALATQLNFSATRAGELAIILTELGNNLVRHGSGGQIMLRPVAPAGGSGGGLGEAPAAGSGVEVTATDRGPGINNVHAAMRDGYSTGGTPGTGLGAIQRLSGTFDLISQLGRGTVIVSRVWPAAVPDRPLVEVGAACVPIRGETVCGDAWCVVEQGQRVVAIVADGLGHGPAAADASRRAVTIFREAAAGAPRQIMEALHSALRATRGAAVAVADVNFAAGKLRFCGVGNISSSVVSREGLSRSLLSHNGTVGAESRRMVELEQPWAAGSLLILTSDGITSRWQLADYPGLQLKHPSLIAGVLYRDHLRGRDDATVLAVRDVRATG